MPDAFQYDVFLSHSAKDKRSKLPTLMHCTGGNPVVRDVAERLRTDAGVIHVEVDSLTGSATHSWMSTNTTTKIRTSVPPEVVKDFAGVRGRVQTAIQASPRSVSLPEAQEQIRRFLNPPRKNSPPSK